MQFSKEIGHPDLSEKVFESKGDSRKDSALLVRSKGIESAKSADKKDTDAASNACFQFRVAKYLLKNNRSFKEKYTDYYASFMGTCERFGIASTSNCNTCYMHPKQQ